MPPAGSGHGGDAVVRVAGGSDGHARRAAGDLHPGQGVVERLALREASARWGRGSPGRRCEEQREEEAHSAALTPFAAVLMTSSTEIDSIDFVVGKRSMQCSQLAIRPVAPRIGRSVEADDLRAQCIGEMQRTGVAADDDLGFLQEPGELAEVRRRRHARTDRSRPARARPVPRPTSAFEPIRSASSRNRSTGQSLLAFPAPGRRTMALGVAAVELYCGSRAPICIRGAPALAERWLRPPQRPKSRGQLEVLIDDVLRRVDRALCDS